jgi:hypothetical protein
LALNVIAHNMADWTARLGGLDTAGTTADGGPARTKSFVATDTLRRHHLSMPGRVSRSARKLILHLPTNWPWATGFEDMLAKLRSVTLVT